MKLFKVNIRHYFPTFLLVVPLITSLCFGAYLIKRARNFLMMVAGMPLWSILLIALVFTGAALALLIYALRRPQSIKAFNLVQKSLFSCAFALIFVISTAGPVFLEIQYIRGAVGVKGLLANYSNLDEWEQRKAMLRAAISQKTGIAFGFPAQPLNSKQTGFADMGNYTVKNLYWETLDNYYVAGNIYLPKNPEFPIPAVMLPHGHFTDNRFNTDNTALAVSLAKLGCLAVTYDMVGRGEDFITLHEHNLNNAIQLHNSIRILDYITSLDYVDKGRIAVTGASGGGTQTMMLSAVDDRVQVSIPVCMLSAYFNGGCQCESGMGYFEGEGYKTSTAEIAAMFAPKDMLVISVGTDWTRNTPKDEFPYLQTVYGFYNEAGNVQNTHFAEEEHNYGPGKRAAAIKYLSGLFGLDYSLYNESESELPAMESLKSYTAESPRPADALTDPVRIYEKLLAYYAE